MTVKLTPEKVREALVLLGESEGVDTRNWLLVDFDSSGYQFENMDTGELLWLKQGVVLKEGNDNGTD